MAAHPVSGTVAAPVWRIYLQLAAVALLWGGTFATLYRKFNHMADAFGPSL